MRSWIRQRLAKHHLDAFADARLRSMRLARRALSGVDRRIVTQYLANHEVRKLHLGCGDHLLTGWLNSSLNSRSDRILELDVTSRFPFPDNSFHFVFSEHLIEHIPFEAALHMLRECYRVLVPGGTIRTTTPDLAFLVALHGPALSDVQRRYVEWAMHELPEPQRTTAGVINHFVRAWGHQFIYDEHTLRRSFTRVGFTIISKRNVSDSPMPALRDLENIRRMPQGFLSLESIVIEADKPHVKPA